jgi:hypothetical protein
VEGQTILVLIQIVKANGTLEPMLDSEKFDGADGVVVAASQWPGLLVFLVVIIILFLGHLLGRLLLGYLLPHERDKTCQQGFVVPEILLKLFFQFFNPHF